MTVEATKIYSVLVNDRRGVNDITRREFPHHLSGVFVQCIEVPVPISKIDHAPGNQEEYEKILPMMFPRRLRIFFNSSATDQKQRS